jgi:hypothetical protein
VDGAGRVLGTRYDPPAILRVDPATGAEEVVAEGGLLVDPVEIEIDRDGGVLAGNVFAGDVVRIDLATGVQAALDTSHAVLGLALVPYAACANGRDDDADGFADWPADPGCRDADWATEAPACQDGRDNDGQIGIDFDGGAAANGGVALDVPDPQCTAPWRTERRSACGLGAELVILAGLSLRRADRTSRRTRSRSR